MNTTTTTTTTRELQARGLPRALARLIVRAVDTEDGEVVGLSEREADLRLLFLAAGLDCPEYDCPRLWAKAHAHRREMRRALEYVGECGCGETCYGEYYLPGTTSPPGDCGCGRPLPYGRPEWGVVQDLRDASLRVEFFPKGDAYKASYDGMATVAVALTRAGTEATARADD